MLSGGGIAVKERSAHDLIIKTLRTLDAMCDLGPGPHRLTDIAEKAKLSTSTAHRILASVERGGWVEHHPNGPYKLRRQAPGHEVEPTGAAASVLAEIPQVAWNELASLQRDTGGLLTVHSLQWHLGRPGHRCSEAIDGHQPALARLLTDKDPRALGLQPLVVGAAGHAILAAMRPRALALADGPMPTCNSLWSERPAKWLDPGEHVPHRLETFALAVADRGFAHTRSEEGCESLAVALQSSAEVCGALCLTFPKALEDLPDLTTRRARTLQVSAEYVQRLLGANHLGTAALHAGS